jgi:hypothetical protein
MTEHQAGRLCNNIYAAYKSKAITRKQAQELLDKLSPYMSTTQYHKYTDFTYYSRHNAHMFEE